VVDTIQFSAFGAITNETNSTYGGLILYAGYRYDRFDGLYSIDARIFNPQTDTWTSQDPLYPTTGPNPYEYCSNNPTNEIDPTGLKDYRWYEYLAVAPCVEKATEWAKNTGYDDLLPIKALGNELDSPLNSFYYSTYSDAYCNWFLSRECAQNGFVQGFVRTGQGITRGLDWRRKLNDSLVTQPFKAGWQEAHTPGGNTWSGIDIGLSQFIINGERCIPIFGRFAGGYDDYKAARFRGVDAEGAYEEAKWRNYPLKSTYTYFWQAWNGQYYGGSGHGRQMTTDQRSEAVVDGVSDFIQTIIEIQIARGGVNRLIADEGAMPKYCFPAGTPVHEALGLKAIEQIAVGDQVWAYDHKELCWVVREVVKVFQLVHQGTMATVQVKGETIRATGGHPFWVVRGEGLAERPKPVRIAAYVVGGRQEGRWVLARHLRAGEEVLLRPGEVVALESVRLDEAEERVYNFHVAELQNYAVGDCGVLVHNTNDPNGPRTPADTYNPATPPDGTPVDPMARVVSTEAGVGGVSLVDNFGHTRPFVSPEFFYFERAAGIFEADQVYPQAWREWNPEAWNAWKKANPEHPE
jgi:RHS repeat-associated protein